MFSWLKRKSGVEFDPGALASAVATEVAGALLDLRKDSGGTGNGEAAAPAQLVARVEACELRVEQLAEQVLRHLQMASQRLKLAERKEKALADLDEEEEPSRPQMQLPLQEPPADEDDFSWARKQLRARGIDPMG